MPRSFGSHDSDHADQHDGHARRRADAGSSKGAKRSGKRGSRQGRSSDTRSADRGESPLRATFGASLDAAAFVGGGGSEGGAPSQRVAQVSALISRVLRERLSRGLNDPRVQGMVSILGVECTPDLAAATVRVSVLPAERARLTLSGIRSATRHLEGIVRKATRLRRVPKLLFELDDSIKREAALNESLNAVRGFSQDSASATRDGPATEPPDDHLPDGTTDPPGDDSTL